MNANTKSDIIKVAPIAIGAITALALVASYMENRRHIKAQLEVNEQQKELTKLLIAEKKIQLNGNSNFRGFVGIKNITSIVPNKKSNTTDWCTFYAEINRRYGKQTADVIFAKAWQERKSDKIATNEVVNCTGLTLDTTWLEDAMSNAGRVKEGVLGGVKTLFNTGTTTYKILVWGGAGLAFVLVGVGIYKLAKFKGGISSIKSLTK